jgi:anti-sigma28 factor (negative regulator of flagellin synthesis)
LLAIVAYTLVAQPDPIRLGLLELAFEHSAAYLSARGIGEQHRGITTMQINSATHLPSTQALGRTTRIDQGATQAPRPSFSNSVDQLDISPEAEVLSRALETKTTFRPDKVAEMKAKIAQGDYDSDEKLDSAMSKMLDDLLG